MSSVLAMNIGNTRFTLGIRESGSGSLNIFRFLSKSFESLQEFVRVIDESLLEIGESRKNINGAIISSVNPGLTHHLICALGEMFSFFPLIVNAEMNMKIDLSGYDTGLLGSDRIAICEAAFERYQLPAIVFDFGTATTINVIDRSGHFFGGSILTGMTMGLSALSKNTAQLPEVEFFIDNPALIGRNTRECLFSGAVFGNAAMLDGMVQRIEEFLGQVVTVLVTGGAANEIIPYCRTNIIYEPELLIEGLYLLYDRNQ